tara:strand:- start:3595 stop:4431 length:837 start_codon:yes stop_codon:yes gene_type:complete
MRFKINNHMQVFIKKFLAFFIKDFKIAVSYKFNIIFQSFFYIFIFSLLFFTYGQQPLLESNNNLSNKENFTTLFMGFALIDYMFSCISVFSREVRLAQTQGTFETLLLTKTSILTIILASYALTFIRATFRVLLYFFICKLFFGMSLLFVDIPIFIAIIFYCSLPFIGIGLFSAAFVIIFKVGNIVNLLIGLGSILFSGIFFSTDLLPSKLSTIGELVPLNIGIDLAKNIILDGYDSINMNEKLSLIGIQILLLLPSGAIFVYYALKIAKKNGSLNYY